MQFFFFEPATGYRTSTDVIERTPGMPAIPSKKAFAIAVLVSGSFEDFIQMWRRMSRLMSKNETAFVDRLYSTLYVSISRNALEMCGNSVAAQSQAAPCPCWRFPGLVDL